MSKYKFKITYRNEDEYGNYCGNNRYTVFLIAETLEQAKQKLDEIEKNDCKNILEWEAEEITEEKDKEIDRLNNIINEIKKGLDKFYKEHSRLLWTEEDYIEFINCIDREIKGVDKE